jgi:hypothetical protein
LPLETEFPEYDFLFADAGLPCSSITLTAISVLTGLTLLEEQQHRVLLQIAYQNLVCPPTTAQVRELPRLELFCATEETGPVIISLKLHSGLQCFTRDTPLNRRTMDAAGHGLCIMYISSSVSDWKVRIRILSAPCDSKVDEYLLTCIDAGASLLCSATLPFDVRNAHSAWLQGRHRRVSSRSATDVICRSQ